MEFKEIARFSSRLEAETIGHALDQHSIPFFVQSHDVGMFGPGHTGPTPGGAGLCVPAALADRATELLHCVIAPATDGAEPLADDSVENNLLPHDSNPEEDR